MINVVLKTKWFFSYSTKVDFVLQSPLTRIIHSVVLWMAWWREAKMFMGAPIVIISLYRLPSLVAFYETSL